MNNDSPRFITTPNSHLHSKLGYCILDGHLVNVRFFWARSEVLELDEAVSWELGLEKEDPSFFNWLRMRVSHAPLILLPEMPRAVRLGKEEKKLFNGSSGASAILL